MCGPTNVAINFAWCIPVFKLVGWWYILLPTGVLLTPPHIHLQKGG
jgi:hypothetical protein